MFITAFPIINFRINFRLDVNLDFCHKKSLKAKSVSSGVCSFIVTVDTFSMYTILRLFASTIDDKLFWQFTVFPRNFDSPQVKRNLISNYNKLCIRVASQFVKRLKTSYLSKTGNEKKTSKLGGDTG